MPVALAGIVAVELVESLQSRVRLTQLASRWPVVTRWPAYIALLLATALFGVYRSNQFIYFQF
jgi:hypothetical protein